MARGINKAIIVGTLGRDPEIKYTPNGAAVVNVSVATNEQYTDKNTGQKVEKTEWHRVVIFAKLAEIAHQYLKKGAQVYFEGKIQTRSWNDTQSGQTRYMTEIVANEMQMLGGRPDGASPAAAPNARPQPSAPVSASSDHFGTNKPADDGFDDIPF